MNRAVQFLVVAMCVGATTQALAQGPGIIDGRGVFDGGGIIDRAPSAGVIDGGANSLLIRLRVLLYPLPSASKCPEKCGVHVNHS